MKEGSARHGPKSLQPGLSPGWATTTAAAALLLTHIDDENNDDIILSCL